MSALALALALLARDDAGVFGAPPRGCVCVDGSSDCNRGFQCECVCNLTPGLCDLDCCCDADCSSEQRSRSAALGACVDDGAVDIGVRECFSTTELEEVNPKGGLREVRDGLEDAIDGMLCVEYDNSENRGRVYSNPGAQDASTVFGLEQGQKCASYERASTCYAPTAAPVLSFDDGIYDRGDFLRARDASGATVAFAGRMPLPGPAIGGRCSDFLPLRFGETTFDAEARTCTQAVGPDDVATACAAGGVLDPRRLVTDVAISSNATLREADAKAVRPTIGAIFFQDWHSGATTLLDSAELSAADLEGCGSFVTRASDFPMGDDSVAPSEPPTIGPTPSDSHEPTAALSIPPSTCAVPVSPSSVPTSVDACRFAVVAIDFYIVHDESDIASVTANVTVTDVPIGDSFVALHQTFTSTFVSGGVSSKARRSGNPGYEVDLPIISRRGNGSADLVGELLLPLRSASQQCMEDYVASSALGASHGQRQLVFDRDVSATCRLDLTLDALRDACTDASALLAAGSNGIFRAIWPLEDALSVGIYGNADATADGDWIDVDVDGPAAAEDNRWDDDELVCRGLYTTAHWRILWAPVGVEKSPQPKLLAVQLAYTDEDVQWTQSLSAGATQPLFLRTTVTFVRGANTIDEYTPPPPPVLFSVPWDFWYPWFVEDEEDEYKRGTGTRTLL